MPNNLVPQTKPQLTLDFQRGPGRPAVRPDRRRQPRSVTLSPEIAAAFDRWAYSNHMSFSRGVEEAIAAFMHGSKNDADVLSNSTPLETLPPA